ncbi:MAG: cation:proton antiporter [Gemmatimonadaceae bacterium]
MLVILPVLAIVAALHLGDSHVSAVDVARHVGGRPAASLFDLPLFILQIVIIVAAAHTAGWALQRLGQPKVVGEMLAGLLVGPSLLGRLAPAASGWLFPSSSIVFLDALARLSLLLFMFLVGLQLEQAALRQRERTAVLTSHASIVAPFLLGVVLAATLYPTMAPAGVAYTSFALFIGAAVSVTAFPVLARILTD